MRSQHASWLRNFSSTARYPPNPPLRGVPYSTRAVYFCEIFTRPTSVPPYNTLSQSAHPPPHCPPISPVRGIVSWRTRAAASLAKRPDERPRRFSPPTLRPIGVVIPDSRVVIQWHRLIYNYNLCTALSRGEIKIFRGHGRRRVREMLGGRKWTKTFEENQNIKLKRF